MLGQWLLRNMAALNYILYVEFDGKFQYGPPVHSAYKRRVFMQAPHPRGFRIQTHAL